MLTCFPAPRQTVLVRPKNCGVNDSFRDLLLDVSPELLERLLRDPYMILPKAVPPVVKPRMKAWTNGRVADKRL